MVKNNKHMILFLCIFYNKSDKKTEKLPIGFLLGR